MTRLMTWLKLGGGAIWGLVVLSYFFFHFPIRNLVEVVFHGVVLLILLCWFVIVGQRLLRLFHVEYASFSEETALAFGAGTGVTILVVFLMATLHLLYEPLIVALILLSGGALYHDLKTFLTRGYILTTEYFRQAHSPGEWAMMVWIGVVLLLTFVGAATPTFFFDALYYHLAVPHKYLLQHGFHYIPYQEFSNVPLNLGMLFIMAMSFSKTLLPQLFSWVFMPMTTLVIYSIVKSIGGKRMALLAAAIFSSIPGGLTISTLTSVECALMFYTIVSLLAFLRYVQSSARFWFVMSAMFCSFAAGTKYTAFVTTVAGMFVVVIGYTYFEKKRGILGTLKTVLLFGVIFGLGMSPWFIKNIVYTGNPLYPFFQSIFNRDAVQSMNFSNILTLDVNPLYVHATTILRDGSGWLELGKKIVAAPWEFTMTPRSSAAKTGAIFLLCLPAVFLLPSMKRPIQYVLSFSGMAFLGWMAALPWIQRYAMPMFPAFSIVCAYFLYRLMASKVLGRALFGSVMLLLSYQIMLFLIEERQTLWQFDYLLAQRSQEEFLLSRGVAHYPAIQYINANTPSDAKILFVAESRGYYCERDYLLHAPPYGIRMDEIPLRQLIEAAPNEHAFKQRLKQLGVTHFLINMREMQRVSNTYFEGKDYLWFPDKKSTEIAKVVFSPQVMKIMYSQNQILVGELVL